MCCCSTRACCCCFLVLLVILLIGFVFGFGIFAHGFHKLKQALHADDAAMRRPFSGFHAPPPF